MKIGILIGGDSSEREVSIASGRSIENACIALGHEVVRLDPKDGLEKIESLLLKVDLVFNLEGFSEVIDKLYADK